MWAYSSLFLLIPDNASKSDFDTLGYEWVNCRPDIQTGESLPSWRQEVRGALSHACMCMFTYLSACLSVYPTENLHSGMRASVCLSVYLISCPSVHAREEFGVYVHKSVSDSSIPWDVAFAELLIWCLPRLQTGERGQPWWSASRVRWVSVSVGR